MSVFRNRVFLLLGFLLIAPAVRAEMGGLVVMVKGDVKLGAALLKPKSPLQKGQKIVVAKGASFLYLSADGRKVAVNGPATHVVGSGAAGKAVPTAAKAMGLFGKGLNNMVNKERDFKNQSGIGGVKRSSVASNPLRMVYPLNSAILESAPKIKWEGHDGTYKVSLQDDLGTEVFNQEVKGKEIALPSSAALMPEAIYTVSVEGPAGGDSIRVSSTFWLPPAAATMALQAAVSELQTDFADTPEAKWLLEAVLFHELQLFHEEAIRLGSLIAKDPGDKTSLLSLLEIQEKMGDSIGAASTREKLSKVVK